jgi:hypothetical protein
LIDPAYCRESCGLEYDQVFLYLFARKEISSRHQLVSICMQIEANDTRVGKVQLLR